VPSEDKAENRMALYQGVLMDHVHQPRNRGGLDGAEQIRRGSNPLCGDDIEVGVFREADGGLRAKFRGRGCALMIASASIMSEVVAGKSRTETLALCAQMKSLLETQAPCPTEALAALATVRNHPARHRCVLLAWEALQQAVGAL